MTVLEHLYWASQSLRAGEMAIYLSAELRLGYQYVVCMWSTHH